jgi:vacuolar protein-sorting-associated protein 4
MEQKQSFMLASLVHKYQKETLYWATKAFEEEKQKNIELSLEYYSKACRSLSCAISFETYEERIFYMNTADTQGIENCSKMSFNGNTGRLEMTLGSFTYPNEMQVKNNKQSDELDVGFEKPILCSSKQAEDQHSIFDGCLVCENINSKGFSEIIGLQEAILCLREAVILPQTHPSIFQGLRKPWRAILLYGPPGTGKTFIARALAKECKMKFFSISPADLLSKWLGQSEKMVRELFKKASQVRPSIVFIDEIDSLCSSRGEQESETARRIKAELLIQLQGLHNEPDQIFVLAATNIPWELDPAIRRRFEKRIYIPLPDVNARYELLKERLVNISNNLTDSELRKVAVRTEGYSCSDIDVLCRSAVMEPVRRLEKCEFFVLVCETCDGMKLYEPCENNREGALRKSFTDFEQNERINTIPEVTKNDFEMSLIKNKPSVDQKDLEKYESFTREFGQNS